MKPGVVPTIETGTADDIEANYNKTLICKEEAVPTIETIGTVDDIVANDTQMTLICKEENTSITFDNNENCLHLYMQSLEMKMFVNLFKLLSALILTYISTYNYF